MTAFLPRDANGIPIQALRLKPGGAQALSVSATSVRSATFSSGTRVIGIYTTGPAYIRTGDAAVFATTADHFIPEGVYFDLSLGDIRDRPDVHTHLAVIQADFDATLHISEKE